LLLFLILAPTAPGIGRLSAAEDPPGGLSVAVLPIWDRSARTAPVREIENSLRTKLQQQGFTVLSPGVVEQFLRRHRVRFTGGINGRVAKTLRNETGALMVLITSIDLYRGADPPKLGLTSRLVTTTRDPRILWMDSMVRSGDQSPGILGLGLISDFARIEEKVVRGLTRSLRDVESPAAAHRRGKPSRNAKTSRRFRPKISYHSSDFPAVRDRAERVAVLPLANSSRSRYAGEIVTDQLIRHLVQAGATMLEPGVVRQVLLETRQIYTKGPSTPDTDILRIDLQADLALYGEVVSYRETGPGAPYPLVDFTLQVVDTRSREVVWSSVSYSKGGDGVFFFDVGSVATAHGLASKMVQALINRAAE
jgi:hypothetical protein